MMLKKMMQVINSKNTIFLGARFGLLQTKLGLATLLRKYRFEVCEKTPIPAVLDPRAFITTLKGGVWLQIKER